MLKSLQSIQQLKYGEKSVLQQQNWLAFLYQTEQKNVNLEQVDSLAEIEDHPVLSYTERTLQILNKLSLPQDSKHILEEVLKWCEVAKCGSASMRKIWLDAGYPLAIHNLASAQIYATAQMEKLISERNFVEEELIYTLIQTHGLIGQYIRGEARYQQLQPLAQLISLQIIPDPIMRELLIALNQCIIEAVSPTLWKNVKEKVNEVILWLITGTDDHEVPFQVRLKQLRQHAILYGEDFEKEIQRIPDFEKAEERLALFFHKVDLWYVESALSDFTLEEFIKIFLLLIRTSPSLTLGHITFEPLMRDLHYDYKGKKAVNLYKKRIIEAYLNELSVEELLYHEIPANQHVSLKIDLYDHVQFIGVTFCFSNAGEKLIEFCQEAEKDPVYERAIILLYDFFGFRKDAFDRLQNEKSYLADMNHAQNFKKKIVDYVVGDTILDIGPGGGFLLDLLSTRYPDAKVIGIDIAANVIAELERKKQREQKGWEVLQGDALDLQQYVGEGQVDTIIFSSILHEMFSYIPYEGKKFHPAVIGQALQSAFLALRPNGRIIIRDGIMTEPKNLVRNIHFRNKADIAFFNRYVHDFKGREIKYKWLDEQTVSLPINDSMEFLYTFTWGEESYPHEVQEQFGYFTPSEYKDCIQQSLGSEANIMIFEHYLQEGYEEHLLDRISLTDESQQPVRLPDSTCFIIIEKGSL
ncbi:class I SAM-dependent methyltransferase [Lederbergia galactosidilytica]|uniref:Methyltransferase domain-containing protein n=1 Tax=Lederbergia galactosidilytica TaxID=217031 RepID=A0A177ZKE1_9BACI|nr:class I SAM-dependent methyltransferase [Lederbergia galactosidilytica]KRG16483.1 hypothetical protein ACA30_01975 [Virgibacillus soli]MBP1914187.1 SAM-dependent methyltransferase [Lederbergia galactosidilytica]OAK67358.1 hypothetical protein ABB05_19600 [Lederbergia galactosidilytica]